MQFINCLHAKNATLRYNEIVLELKHLQFTNNLKRGYLYA